MVNDLKDLMRQNVAAPPPDHLDLDALVDAGRRRARAHRFRSGVVVAGTVAALAVGASLLPSGTPPEQAASGRPSPDAPTIGLTAAAPAVEGQDYRVLASYTNENLNRDNGQYLDGVTEDGQILFQDGPRMDQWYPRFALMDPETSEKDWLPQLEDVEQTQTWPVHLGADELVLTSLSGNGMQGRVTAHVFDREAREWRTMQWPGLPKADFPTAEMGPDGRLYVLTTASRPGPPPGGWPTGVDGEAEDADAEGETNFLWSVSLTDENDVRDEGMTVGDIAFTDSSLVWTDSSGGDAGLVHVRDLATGKEHSFDPRAGERCNLLSFGATDDRIMMSQYCGTYPEGRDDRVQILTTDGEQVVTIQGDGIDGWLPQGSNVVNVTSYDREQGGTYVYDLGDDRLLRVSDAVSSWGLGGPTGDPQQFMWHTPVNNRNGATQYIGELIR